MSTMNTPSRVIIIGGNFAGLTGASKLSKNHDVTVIDTSQNFQWTPNIHEILSDVKKDTSLNIDLRTVIPKLGHTFIHSKVDAINTQAQTVSIATGRTLPYDVLLIATGHTLASYDIEGAEQHAIGFRTASDVTRIATAIQTRLHDSAGPVYINIVGGGFTGVEVLGELLRKYAGNARVHINVIDSGPRLVQALPEKLASDIVSQCHTHQVRFYFNQRIVKVSAANIQVAQASDIPNDVCIWSAGTKLPDYIDTLNTPKMSSGIPVNTCLQTENFENIFVAGDSASLLVRLPKQSSMAIDMGLHAANNINRFLAKQSLRPFSGHIKPVLLSLGDINTYFIQGNLVLASPLLASAKEAVYQFWMARLSALLPLDQGIAGIAGRLVLSTEKLLLAEVLKARPRVLLDRSKRL